LSLMVWQKLRKPNAAGSKPHDGTFLFFSTCRSLFTLNTKVTV
jgi:hypothetical protein